jgi:uncharacterized phage-associated protein
MGAACCLHVNSNMLEHTASILIAQRIQSWQAGPVENIHMECMASNLMRQLIWVRRRDQLG